MLFIFVFLIVAIVIFARCVRIVPQAECYVIEFLGKYKTSWESGLHVKIPFLERISKKVSLKEQVSDFPPQPVITKDNVTMRIDTVVYWYVYDSKLFAYGAENPIFALENLSATTLRNIIGDLDLDSTLTSRDTINTKMKEVLDKVSDAWGIKVNRVELKNIMPPKEIQEAMESQMKAERDKRKKILDAEAHKESERLRAEGNKEAAILDAEAEKISAITVAAGKAEAIRLQYEAEAKGIKMLNDANMSEKVLMMKKLEALQAMGDGRATKIVVPTELAGAAANLQFAGEMLGMPGTESVDKSEEPKKEIVKEDPCYPNINEEALKEDPCCE